jgi:outer membrane lipase/esterase
LTNVTVPACDAAKIAVITGGRHHRRQFAVLQRHAGVPFNGLRTGADVNTWQFADGVHPTTGGQKVFSDELQAAARLRLDLTRAPRITR